MSAPSPLQPVRIEAAVERERALQRRNSAAIMLYAWICFGGMSLTFASVAGQPFPRNFLIGAVGGIIGGTLTVFVVRVVHWVTQQGMRAVLEPGGARNEDPVYSHAESLAARGNVGAASKAFEQARAEHGDKAVLLRAEADMQLRASGDPERARELLMRLRRAEDVTRADELYATHRLVDLYLGPLADEARAVAELRRLAERFPGTRDAEGALIELERRKVLRVASHRQQNDSTSS